MASRSVPSRTSINSRPCTATSRPASMHRRPKRLLALVVLLALVGAAPLVRSPLRTAVRWHVQGAVELALAAPFPAPAAVVAVPPRIAHGGGGPVGVSLTNSPSAPELNLARRVRPVSTYL